MDWQALVVEVRRGRLLVRPLDGVRPTWLKVPRCDQTYIENELLRLAPLPEGASPDAPSTVEILGSDIDPSYIDARPPMLELWDDEEKIHGFKDHLSPMECDDFESAMELFRTGRTREARKALLDFLSQHPSDIDSYHHLGNLAFDQEHLARALKYYEMGYRIGRQSIPADFTGRLPWSILENRPFLRAAHGRALVLMRLGRSIDAADGLGEILRFNPNDNLGVRYLLPGLLAANGSWSRAREALDSVGVDGTNLYTRCLIDVNEGRRRDALRWLFAAVSHNPYVPEVLLGTRPANGMEESSSGYLAMGQASEAQDYAQHHDALWKEGNGKEFLRRVLEVRPFAERLQRVLEINRLLEGLPPGNERSRLVDERFGLFDDEQTQSFVGECEQLL